MTDYPKALAALREARDENASIGHEPVSWFLVDAALAALEAARGEAVAWQYRFATPDGLTWSDWQPIPSEAMARQTVDTFGKMGTRAEWRSLKVFEWGGYAGECTDADFADERAQQPAAAVPAANVTPMRQPRLDLSRLVDAIDAAIYEHGKGLTVTECIGALELAKLELFKEQEK